MVYQAKVLFLSLLLIGSWRLVVKNSNFVDWFELPSWLQGMGLPKKLPKWLKQPLHYYVILYFMLGVLLFNSLHDTVKIMCKTDFMDVWAFHLPDSVPQEERNFPRWLFSVSAYTPLASIATFVVSVGHTLVHFSAIRGIELQQVVDQDRAILVIALPAVYGAMAFKSVIRMWILFTGCQIGDACGSPDSSWETKKTFILDAYDSNYDTADLYEAYALYLFAQLCMSQVTKRTSDSGASTLTQTVEALTMQGVMSFVIVCFLQATYKMVLTIYVRLTDDTTLPGLSPYLTGAGLVASSAAISNVVTVEHSLETYLHDFRPSAKFWSAKVLVSIAFLQQTILSILSHFLGAGFTELQQNLLYSSLICYEVLLVSFFHMYAWRTSEPWLKSSKQEPLLSGGP
ncbi:unnamed protein product [Symbiodinium sp. CCMP2456]|nr:unnamed protein product [Symbiodinium sp. CCMP2456]